IPVGQMVSGEIVNVVDSISSRENMRDAKLIHMKHESGAEFLMPLTGTIKKAIGGIEGVKGNIGKTLAVIRQPDGETEKYGGKKKVFMFDVFISE
ncbi:MAG: hypothetical protein KGJ13_06960, partial [Patescibacteria group bacterium]|nr:hypothetical protein [Patescibacteria group bacterium]